MPRCRAEFALLLAGMIAIAAGPGLCQRGSRGGPPSSSAAPDGPVEAQSSGPVTTLKASAQLVVVDVVVTDSKQSPIHDLTLSDFKVLENNSRQQITGFEEHRAQTQPERIAPMRPLPAGIFSNYTPAPKDSAVNVLLLDALNTQDKDQSYVRDQLREYLKNTPAGARVAIFGLNNHLVLLQGFTTDPALLKAAVEKAGTSPSALLADNVGNGGTQTAAQAMRTVAGADMGQVIASLQRMDAVQGTDDANLRVTTTLNAMKQLAHYLGGFPGRKNLIWFSGSFPLQFGSQAEGQMRETTKLLARSEIAVYPIGARGLVTAATPVAASDAPRGGRSATRAQANFSQTEFDDTTTMDEIAAETGGHAYLNSSGLSQAVSQATENGSNYYTLSYTPTNEKADGKFRSIQVKLEQPGLTLTYRNGYFADEPGAQRSKHAPEQAATSTSAAVMMEGAPDATEILLKLQVLPASNATEDVPAAGNRVTATPAAKMEFKGPFRRYAIDIAADARDIKMTPTPDGRFQFSVEMLTFVYDASGTVIDTAALKVRGNLSTSSYANMRHTGVPFHQEISVPAQGEYTLRTSLHDMETDHYGTVEIPVAKVGSLTPLAASAAPVAAK